MIRDPMKREDVPLDLVNAFRRAEVMAAMDEDDPVRAFLAHFLPATYKHWFAQAFGTDEEIRAREAEAAARPRRPDQPIELCERIRPGEHERRVRARAAEEISDPSVWPDPIGRWTADQADAARAMKAHILRCITRGEALTAVEPTTKENPR